MLADAQAAATYTHPNLVAVHDYGETPGQNGEPLPFVVMELLTGRSLADPTVVDSLAPRDAIKIGAQVAGALAALHERGIVHSAIRPSNVILTPAGAKVVDFSTAALTDPPELDRLGEPLGTPSYLAPERMFGGEASAAADVYALGVLIYRLLAHELPWPTHTSAEATRARLMGLEPKPLPRVDGVAAEVNDMVRRCLDRDPALRPSAAEVAVVWDQATQGAAQTDDVAAWRTERRMLATDRRGPDPAAPTPAHRNGDRPPGAWSPPCTVVGILAAVAGPRLRNQHRGHPGSLDASHGRLRGEPHPVRPGGDTTGCPPARPQPLAPRRRIPGPPLCRRVPTRPSPRPVAP